MRRAQISIVGVLLGVGLVWTAACGDRIQITPAKLPPRESAPLVVSAPPPPEKKPIVVNCPSASLQGDMIKMPNHIEFESDKGMIKETDKETMDALQCIANVLKDNPQITKMRVEGHTDNQGNPDKNRLLSYERTVVVISWLVGHGVDKNRLESQGFGADKPKDTNDTPAGRRENRRVEFRIAEVEGKPFQP
jgi:outer membrane protein OmpA-like peptidoglycan-associated protein